MPIQSSLSQFTFINHGPLTTTFTAPRSCPSQERFVQIAARSSPQLGEWLADCSLTYGDCLPSGTVTPAATDTDSPLAAFELPYFSPGLHCPSGWETVGAAWQTAGGISTDGVYASLAAHTIYRWPVDILPSLLSSGETAVLCCPSSMTGARNGICYSTLPNYELTTGCQRYIPPEDYALVTMSYEFGNQLISGEMISITDTIPSATETTTFAATETESLVGVSVMAMVTLIHTNGVLPGGGLSTGASAGIGVGVGLLVIGIIAAGVAFFWIRRKRKRMATVGAGVVSSNVAGPAPDNGVELDAQKTRAELDYSGPQGELYGTQADYQTRPELGGLGSRMELSAVRRFELAG
ncbi:hypothetical protein BJX63DRAFT_433892 [Aspergillus granulosus]|uniref:Uncharacterized protein n=1 Tax=Aspergillus granulosus TaxID=176169 RepID=A0ABR4H5Q6_9EURO